MNKLLIFPLGFMFILTIFTSLYAGGTFTGYSEDYSGTGEGGSIMNQTTYVHTPTAGSYHFSIVSASAVLLILSAAIIAGAAVGFHVLGSGLTETSQKYIFNSILFLGLWAILTVVSSMYIFYNTIATALWISLTVMYVIGYGTEMNK